MVVATATVSGVSACSLACCRHFAVARARGSLGPDRRREASFVRRAIGGAAVRANEAVTATRALIRRSARASHGSSCTTKPKRLKVHRRGERYTANMVAGRAVAMDCVRSGGRVHVHARWCNLHVAPLFHDFRCMLRACVRPPLPNVPEPPDAQHGKQPSRPWTAAPWTDLPWTALPWTVLPTSVWRSARPWEPPWWVHRSVSVWDEPLSESPWWAYRSARPWESPWWAWPSGQELVWSLVRESWLKSNHKNEHLGSASFGRDAHKGGTRPFVSCCVD